MLANCKGFWGPCHQSNHSGIMDDSMILLSIFGSLQTINNGESHDEEREKIFQFLLTHFIDSVWHDAYWERKKSCKKSCCQMLTGYVWCIVKHITLIWWHFHLDGFWTMQKCQQDVFRWLTQPPNNRQMWILSRNYYIFDIKHTRISFATFIHIAEMVDRGGKIHKSTNVIWNKIVNQMICTQFRAHIILNIA